MKQYPFIIDKNRTLFALLWLTVMAQNCEYGVLQITNAKKPCQITGQRLVIWKKKHTHIFDLTVFPLYKTSNMHIQGVPAISTHF